MHLKISSAKWRQFCPAGDELTVILFPVTRVLMVGTISIFTDKHLYGQYLSAIAKARLTILGVVVYVRLFL